MMRLHDLLPNAIVRYLKRGRYHVRRFIGSRRLRQQIQASRSLRVVVGSEGLVERGWLRTEIEYLNVLQRSEWTRYFTSNSIDAILAEHVWEHLTRDEGLAAIRLCFEFLRPGGRLRLAVPDGYHSAPGYIDQVKPGGSGLGADDHKLLYNHPMLSELLTEVGFIVEPLEYFDASGKFHAVNWEPADGMIHRSARFDERNAAAPLRYTSLIIDAHKPR